MNGPSADETEAIFGERLGDLAGLVAEMPAEMPTTPAETSTPTTEERTAEEMVVVRVTVHPDMAAHLIQRRLDVHAGDLNGLGCLLGHLLDPLLKEMAAQITPSLPADAHEDDTDG